MPEIRTSGSMSGGGKRSVAAWPELPRPSSTLPSPTCRHVRDQVRSQELNGRPPGMAERAVHGTFLPSAKSARMSVIGG